MLPLVRPSKPRRPREEGRERPSKPWRSREEGRERPSKPQRTREEGRERPVWSGYKVQHIGRACAWHVASSASWTLPSPWFMYLSELSCTHLFRSSFLSRRTRVGGRNGEHGCLNDTQGSLCFCFFRCNNASPGIHSSH